MLTLPNINSPNTLVNRPVLVADSVRPSSPLPAIEPTTAVSRERSRAENKVPEGVPANAGQASGRTVKSAAARETLADRALPTSSSGAVDPAQSNSQPPSEKTAVQKALETQVKSLLNDIWKASAVAVNFLLGRDEPTASQLAVSTEPLSAIHQSLSGRKPFVGTLPQSSGSSSSSSGSGVYSARGAGDASSSNATGQLLDVLA